MTSYCIQDTCNILILHMGDFVNYNEDVPTSVITWRGPNTYGAGVTYDAGFIN